MSNEKTICLNNGDKYSMWTVVSGPEKRSNGPYWLCKCDCGVERYVLGRSVASGRSKGCGCTRRENAASAASKANTKHGMRHSRLYVIWRGIKLRTTDSRTNSFDRYGGRGISMCDDWFNDFSVFANWAFSNGYSDDLSIDRIDGDDNYYPENCRWSTPSDQAKNRRPRERDSAGRFR